MQLEQAFARSNLEKAKVRWFIDTACKKCFMIHQLILPYLQLEETNMRLGHELLTSNQEKAKLEEQLFRVEKRKASQEELLLVVQKRIYELEKDQKKSICHQATPTNHSEVSETISNEVR